MITFKIDWVIAFEICHQEEVLNHANSHDALSTSFSKNGDRIYLHIKGESDSFGDWLEYAIGVIDYHQNIAFFDKHEQSIIHVYVPFHDENDKVDLSFTAKSAGILERLSTVFDIDYYAYFDVY
ncbi:MAG: hypothetical protein Q4A69_09050 [Moraxella sp.]|nr:hypothetical protein [Moraxella sp.]